MAKGEVIARAEGIVRYDRSAAGGDCICCDGVHIYGQHIEGVPEFGFRLAYDAISARKGEIEGKTVRITVELLDKTVSPPSMHSDQKENNE